MTLTRQSIRVANEAPLRRRFRIGRNSRALFAVVALMLILGAVSYALAAISTAPTGQKNWYWQNPLPQGNALYGVDSPGAGEVWAVGDPGVILHSTDDGAVWEPQDSTTTVVLRAVDFVDSQRGLDGWRRRYRSRDP